MALKMDGVSPQQIRLLLERKRKDDLPGLLEAQKKGCISQYLRTDLQEIQRQNCQTQDLGASTPKISAASSPEPQSETPESSSSGSRVTPTPSTTKPYNAGTSSASPVKRKASGSKLSKKQAADMQKKIQRLITKKKKEDFEGLMKAWGEGRLQEYLAPDLKRLEEKEKAFNAQKNPGEEQNGISALKNPSQAREGLSPRNSSVPSAQNAVSNNIRKSDTPTKALPRTEPAGNTTPAAATRNHSFRKEPPLDSSKSPGSSSSSSIASQKTVPPPPVPPQSHSSWPRKTSAGSGISSGSGLGFRRPTSLQEAQAQRRMTSGGSGFNAHLSRRGSNSSVNEVQKPSRIAGRQSLAQSGTPISVGDKVYFVLNQGIKGSGVETRATIIKKQGVRMRVEYDTDKGKLQTWADSREMVADDGSSDDESTEVENNTGSHSSSLPESPAFAASRTGSQRCDDLSSVTEDDSESKATVTPPSPLATAPPPPVMNETVTSRVVVNTPTVPPVIDEVADSSIHVFLTKHNLGKWTNDVMELADELEDLKELTEEDTAAFVDEVSMTKTDEAAFRKALVGIGAHITVEETPSLNSKRRPSNMTEAWLHRTVTRVLVPTPEVKFTLEKWIDEQRDATNQPWMSKYKEALLDMADSLEDFKEMEESEFIEVVEECKMTNTDSRRLRRAVIALGADIRPEASEEVDSRFNALQIASPPVTDVQPTMKSDSERLKDWIASYKLSSFAEIITSSVDCLEDFVDLNDDDFDEFVQEANMKWSDANRFRDALISLGAQLT